MADSVKELVLTICGDMLEPIGYMPHGMIAGFLFLVVYLLGILAGRAAGIPMKVQEKKRVMLLYLCVVYGTVLLETAFFSREPGSRIGVNMELFGTWGETAASKGYVIENILMFIPFGILFPACFRFLKNGFVCVAAACLTSVAIETAQYLTGRGFCQLDDVVMNVLGTTLGWLLYRIFCNSSDSP